MKLFHPKEQSLKFCNVKLKHIVNLESWIDKLNTELIFLPGEGGGGGEIGE